MTTSDPSTADAGSPFWASRFAVYIYYAGAILSAILLWGFTADDSFIVYRYAENLASGNGLAYNPGELVSALTSPLHALLCSLLAILPVPVLASNKVLALLVVVASLRWTSKQLAPGQYASMLLVGLVIASPIVILWSVGGLETPYLLSLLAISLGLFYRYRQQATPRRGLLLSFACGCCFLLRFDSALLVAPLLIHAIAPLSRQAAFRGRQLVCLVLPATILVTCWLLFSRLYFHDIFPTSYYSKGITFSWVGAGVNVSYMLQFLVFSGLPIVLFVFLAVAHLRPTVSTKEVVRSWAVRHRGILIGLGFSAAYGTGMATTHMMFSYRFLVPLLPLLFFLAIDLFRDLRIPAMGVSVPSIVATSGCLLVLQGTLLTALLTTTLNPGLVGEYRRVDARQYQRFTTILADQSVLIRDHWESRHASDDVPTIYVYAAGIPGHILHDYRIVDSSIISYRHYFRGRSSGISGSADYLMATTRHGPLSRQLGGLIGQLEPLHQASRELLFDGKTERFEVYYNPAPEPLRLPPYIDGPEESPGSSREGNSMQ